MIKGLAASQVERTHVVVVVDVVVLQHEWVALECILLDQSNPYSNREKKSAPFTGWTFFTLIFCKNCMHVYFKKTENKRKRGRRCPF